MTTPGVGASPDASRDSSAEGGGLTTARDASLAAQRTRGHNEGAKGNPSSRWDGSVRVDDAAAEDRVALGSGGARGCGGPSSSRPRRRSS